MTSHYNMILVMTLSLYLPFLEARQVVNVRAAFYSGGSLFLFNNQLQALSINPHGAATVYPENIFGAPNDYAMTAAVYEKSNLFGIPIFVFFGVETIFYQGQVLHYDTDGDYYSFKFPNFLWHGLDAATTEGPVHYFFKGCNYITSDRWRNFNSNPRPVGELNIPCNVDAAWHDGSDTLVLKGDQVWVVGGDNQSRAFDNYRRQEEWKIQPSNK